MTEDARWLIATDVDGTLLDETLEITSRVREAIAAAQNAGHIVTLATGRMYKATALFAEELGIHRPIICYQGALVRQGEEVLYHQPLPLDIAQECIAYAHEVGLHVHVYVDDVLYIEQPDEETAFYLTLAPMAPIEAVGDLSTYLTREPTKILFVLEPEQTTIFLEYARTRWGARAHVVQSHARFVELAHADVSKGNSVLFLANQIGIPRERILAVGDNHNDISMIQMAGVGVAMGGAAPAIQAIADWVAPSVRESGLAAAIEKFVLNNRI